MRTFINISPEIHFNRQWSDFDYLYNRLLSVGLAVGVILLGISLAYLLVYFSPLFAMLAVLAVPGVILLVTRPQLGLLLVIFAIAFEDFGAAIPGMSGLKLLSVAVFGGAIVHFLVFRRKESLVSVTQNWLILLFIGGIILSNFTALDPTRTLDRTGRILRVLTLYLMVINLVRSQKVLTYLIWTFLIAGFISALWGLLDPAQVGERLYGTMGQPNDFASAMVPCLALALCLLNVEKHWLKRVPLLIMIAVIIYATILSGSRGGLMGMVLALILFALTQKNKLIWFSLVGFIVVTGLTIMPLSIKQRIGIASTVRSDELSNSTDRRETYQIYGWELWQENPVFGVGLDGFATAYAQSEYRFLQRNQLKRVAHNTYLEIGVGTGLVGFIPFILLLGWSLYRAWQYARYEKTSLYLAGLSAGLFAAQGGYFLSMLFGSRQYDKTPWLLIAMVVVVQELMNARQETSFRNQDQPVVMSRESYRESSF